MSDFLADLGYLSFVTRLKRISDRMIHDGRRMYRELGLDIEPNWYAVFLLLKDKGPMTVTQIANHIGFSHPSIVNIVNKMRDAGYLECVGEKGDNRKRIVKLSTKATNSLPEFERIWQAGVSSMRRMLPERDVLETIALIESKLDEAGFKDRTLECLKADKEVEVRLFRPEYAEYFAALNYDWIEESYEVEAHDREQLDEPQKSIIDNGGQIFVAFAGTSPVGAVALINEGNGNAELAKMGVTTSSRGLGVGDELMKAFINYARDNGFKRIILESNRKQVPAIRLYKKFGFKEIPLNPDTPYERCDIRMDLILSTAVGSR